MGACSSSVPPKLNTSTFFNAHVTGDTDPSTFLYVLACEHGMYYVGKSSNVRARYAQHAAGTGCAWTKAHKPLQIVESTPSTDATAEDALVKVYMLKHGIKNVRGGSYSNVTLTHTQLAALQAELRSATNACFLCDATDHFADNCPKRGARCTCCTRCGRSSHTEAACFAKTHVDGVTVL